MTFDTWTVAAVADELTKSILGGRVQQVVQVDQTTVALEVYANRVRHHLLASADRQAPRLHLASAKPRRGVDSPSPLLQLLRKFVRGSALVAVSQPRWERMLILKFQHPQLGASELVAELIGRWANLLLLRPAKKAENEWRILECVHRYRPKNVDARTVLPGKIYQPPPPQSGWPPETLSEYRLRSLLSETETERKVWQALVEAMVGVSPASAREMVFRATGDAQTRVAQIKKLQPLVHSVEEFVSMIEEDNWQPCTVVDEVGRRKSFAAYWLGHRQTAGFTVQGHDTISNAVESTFGQKTAMADDSYGQARRHVDELIDKATRKVQKRQEAIQREVRSKEEIEAFRVSGEWILALATQIAPRQQELDLPDGVDLATGKVAMDPGLTPAENAATYFKRYRKAKRATEAAQDRLMEGEAELAYLEQLSTDLILATDRNGIDAVHGALIEAGYARHPTTPGARLAQPPDQPRRFTSHEGYVILVGRNSRQNEKLTFTMADPTDLWLHARGWPGSHVIIRSGDRPVSDETLQAAASLAAYYSRARDETSVDVIVTPKRRVRRAPGKRPGMVLVDEEKVVRARPRPDMP